MDHAAQSTPNRDKLSSLVSRWHQLRVLQWHLQGILLIGLMLGMLIRFTEAAQTRWVWLIAEAGIPIAMTWLGATLLMCDPLLEVYAATMVSLRRVWLQRIVIVLGALVVASFVCQLIAPIPMRYGVTLVAGAVAAFGLASVFTSVMASWAIGGMLSTIFIVQQVILAQHWLANASVVVLWFFPLASFVPDSPQLNANRLALLLTGILCLGLAWHVLGHEERIIKRWGADT